MKETGERQIDLLAGITRIIVGQKFVPLDQLDWHSGPHGSNFLTLNEISQQLDVHEVIYVWVESGLRGTIYQCNNYSDGAWYKHGTTKGFA